MGTLPRVVIFFKNVRCDSWLAYKGGAAGWQLPTNHNPSGEETAIEDN
jgi:hypothetical protein